MLISTKIKPEAINYTGITLDNMGISVHYINGDYQIIVDDDSVSRPYVETIDKTEFREIVYVLKEMLESHGETLEQTYNYNEEE